MRTHDTGRRPCPVSKPGESWDVRLKSINQASLLFSSGGESNAGTLNTGSFGDGNASELEKTEALAEASTVIGIRLRSSGQP
jgi:hypothetical protein